MSQEDAAKPPIAEAADLSEPGQEAELREDPPFLADDSPVDSGSAAPEQRVFDAQSHAVTTSAVEKVLADLH